MKQLIKKNKPSAEHQGHMIYRVFIKIICSLSKSCETIPLKPDLQHWLKPNHKKMKKVIPEMNLPGSEQ